MYSPSVIQTERSTRRPFEHFTAARVPLVAIDEARQFHHYFRLPKGWVIICGSLVVLPLPATEEVFRHAILAGRDKMTEAEHNRPENHADNSDA